MYFLQDRKIRCRVCGEVIPISTFAGIGSALCTKCQVMEPDYIPQHVPVDTENKEQKIEEIQYTLVIPEQMQESIENQIPDRTPKSRKPKVSIVQVSEDPASKQNTKEQLSSALGRLKKTWKKPKDPKKKSAQ